MNKSSFLPYLNSLVLIFVLCSQFGLIEPKNWLDNFSQTSGVQVITPIQKVEKALATHETALEYLRNNASTYASKSDLDRIKYDLQSMKGQTNLSNEIKYWQYKYNSSPNYCDNYRYRDTEVCKEIRDKIFNLQLKLHN